MKLLQCSEGQGTTVLSCSAELQCRTSAEQFSDQFMIAGNLHSLLNSLISSRSKYGRTFQRSPFQGCLMASSMEQDDSCHWRIFSWRFAIASLVCSKSINFISIYFRSGANSSGQNVAHCQCPAGHHFVGQIWVTSNPWSWCAWKVILRQLTQCAVMV